MSWSTTLKNRQRLRAQIEAQEEIAVMFSDIRGFSSYTAEKGDEAAYRLAQLHTTLLRERIAGYNGVLVKTLGDGIMGAFAQPTDALNAAVAIQRSIRARNQETPDEPIDVGIGLATGLPVVSDTDMIGHSVNLSQRISGLAKGGQILVTKSIRDVVPLEENLRYLPFGRKDLKGIGTETLYEVLWLGEVSRISDAEDHFTLVLTDEGTVVLELAKQVQDEINKALGKLEEEKEGSFSSFLQRAIARFTRKIIDSSLAAAGIAREQDIDQVELSLEGKDLTVQLGKKTLHLESVDPTLARAFVATVDAYKRDREKPSPPAAGR
jgi:class 3 adenylate cyclase